MKINTPYESLARLLAKQYTLEHLDYLAQERLKNQELSQNRQNPPIQKRVANG
jgi:hypothetical protein